MNNPVVLYNLMMNAIQYGEYEEAVRYATELDDIVGYNYYVLYVQDQYYKREAEKDKCLKRYNKFIGSEE